MEKKARGVWRGLCLLAVALVVAEAYGWRKENVISSGDVQALREKLQSMLDNGETYDYVSLQPGTYDVSVLADNPMQGESYWMGKTLLRGPTGTILRSTTGNPEDVVIDAKGISARILLVGSGFEVQGITFKNADARNIKASYNTGAAIATTGGSLCTATNCRFIGNKAAKGGAVQGIACVNCYFEGNETYGWGSGGAALSCQLKNCTFVGNTVNEDYCNGGAASECKPVIDCVAISNRAPYGAAFASCKGVTNCTARYNYATRKGGAFYRCETIAGCVVEGNGASSGGAALSDTSATNSVFQFNCGAVHARDTTGYYALLDDCEIIGNRIQHADVNRCRVHGITNSMTVVGNVHFADAWTGTHNYVFMECRNLRNTLVYDCQLLTWSGNLAIFYASEDVVSSVENVTVADCTYSYLARGFSSATRSISFINALVGRNVNPSGNNFDVTGYESPYMLLQNCVLGRVDARFAEGYGLVDSQVLGEGRYADILFQGTGDTPYATRLASPCCATGLVADWMTDAVDLAGNPRLREGAVDVGCYECWLPHKGTYMVFR